MKAVSGKNLIGYTSSAKGDVTFQSVDPATGRSFPVTFHEATEEETELALQLAHSAFPGLMNLSIARRTEFLHAVASELEANQEDLADTFCAESALPRGRAETELKRTCFQLRSYSDAVLKGFALQAIIDPADPDRKPAPKPDLRKVNQAIGPVVVFGASNFPFAYSTAGGDTASALAAGCPVIVKGHPMHPYTSELVASLVIKTAKRFGLPEGVFSHLHAKGFEAAEKLVKDPRVKGVGFTGSIKGGMALYKLAAEREDPIPVFAEMGSVNPVFVTDEAMKERSEEIAAALSASVSLNAGQFCTSPGLLFVLKNDRSEAFIRSIAENLEQASPQTMLHPGIFKSYTSALKEQEKGTDVLVEKQADLSNAIIPGLARITGKEFLENPSRQDEVFGSFLLIVSCEKEEQLTACSAALRGQLTGSVFLADAEKPLGRQLIENLGKVVGRVVINGVPTGVEVSPAMHHGGTFPASTDSRFTSVGNSAVLRWMRPVSFQSCPDDLLPEALKKDNPLKILRFINESWTIDRW